jgi:hypothetical protein
MDERQTGQGEHMGRGIFLLRNIRAMVRRPEDAGMYHAGAQQAAEIAL